jgi:hypothetical protein
MDALCLLFVQLPGAEWVSIIIDVFVRNDGVDL